jgi:hypothetical protein
MAPGPRDGGAEAAARYRQYEYKAVRAFGRPRATTTMTTTTRESTRERVILFRRRDEVGATTTTGARTPSRETCETTRRDARGKWSARDRARARPSD